MTAVVDLPAIVLGPGLAAGPSPDGWIPLPRLALVVIVGVTGVGKSTALAAVTPRAPCLSILPDRRALTDAVILPAVAPALGLPLPITDRVARLAATRAFRDRAPDGMADVLASLSVPADHSAAVLMFDGLRGINEVAAAVRALPRARFVCLTAPDGVRLCRLLDRGDPFDGTAPAGTPAQPPADVDALRGLLATGDLAAAIPAEDREAVVQQLAGLGAPLAEVDAKARILLAERDNYDPVGTIQTLCALAAERTTVIDTSVCDPDGVAEQIVAVAATVQAESGSNRSGPSP